MNTLKIKKLAHETYQIRFYDERGNRKKRNFKTKLEAETFKQELITQEQRRQLAAFNRAQGIVVESDIERKLIQDALAEMYQQKLSSAFNKDSVKQEKFNYNLFGKFIFEEMGRDYCDEITLLDLEKFRQKEKDRGIKNASIERRFNFVRAFLNYCVAHKYRRDNPAEHIKKLYVEVIEPELWSEGDSEKIIEQLPEWASEFILVLKDTMARPIELNRLKFSDINFFNKTVSLISAKGASVHKRKVPLTEQSIQILRAIEQRRGPSQDQLVFVNSKGRPVTTSVMNKALKVARRELGLSEGLKAYGFRHGGLSQLNRLNVNQRLISKVAGHRKAETTQRYLHTNEDELRNVIDLTEAMKSKKAL